MSKLTKEKGFEIREYYSNELEKIVCERHNLFQIGGTKTKIDGSNGIVNKSIKNASGSSTQVHLTTQKKFIESLKIDINSAKFINLFCGDKNINNNGTDRYSVREIEPFLVESFKNFLNENKIKIIDLIVRNGFDITHIIFNDIKNKKEYELSYSEIITKCLECEWVFLRGGIHLKNFNGKTYFHLQREGKKNSKNRYNVLLHIHKNLFI